MPYLITGATGPVGKNVVAQLRAAGHGVRIVTRNTNVSPVGVETIHGDFTKGDLALAAFAGVDRAFLFPAQAGVEAFLKQAKQARIGQLVVLSSLAAAMDHERDRNSPSALHHLGVEKAVLASGIPATFLRPGSFANNLLFWAHSIRTGDVVYGPYAKSSQAPIHEGDIAAVAVAALTQNGHLGKIYPMTGPQALTRIEQLDTIAAALGKKLRFHEIPPESFAQEMGKYMPQPIIKMLLDYWSDTVAIPDVVLPTIEQITGQKARSLAQWAKDHAPDFT